MKKLVCVLLVFTLSIPAFAETLKVTGTAPITNDPTINANTQDAFQKAIDELNGKFTFDSPTKFLQGMGNSSVYASHGATTRGYGGYKIFSATIGLTTGLQLPESIGSVMNDIDEITDSLERDGDIKLGLSPNFFNVNVGLNMGVFKSLPKRLGLLKRDHLYFGVRVGYFKLPTGLFEGVNYSSLTLGLTANYQLIPTISLAKVIQWRGVNVGTGFIYNSSSFGISGLSLGDSIEEPIGATGAFLVMGEPKASLNMDVTTFTIPLEAVTAIKLLIFNIPLGIGVDIAFGKTSLTGGVTSDIGYKGLPPGTYQTSKGDLSVSGGVSNSPSIFNFKIMTGLGINAGPVVFDIPITYYPASGYSVGITAGAVY